MAGLIAAVAWGALTQRSDPSFAAGGQSSPNGATGRTLNPCHVARRHLRCPDLIMSAPTNFQFDSSTRPGRVLLRASSSIDNRGRGPLELSATRTGTRHWTVYQVIFDQRGRAHRFRTSAALVFKFIPGERYGVGNVGDARYWKLKHAAGFQLWSVGAHFKALALVRRSPKVAYCLRDLFRTAPSRVSPIAPVFPACSQEPGIRSDTLGTSVGWSDVYPSEYPEQWIDVTGLRGRFAFVQRVDPDHLLIESNHRNDVSETYIQLPSGRILGHRIGASRP
jgi:Lysyl oxidase